MADGQEYSDMGNNEFQQDSMEDFEQQNQEGDADVKMNGADENGGTENSQQDSGSAIAPGKDDDRKLFVGGLSWETTDKELREYFNKYGDIESINVKTDPNTGRSRGFAFIVFTNAESLDKVLCAGEHVINNKKVDPKKAKARHGKIFVGGLVPEISDDDIKNYFAQYGSIMEVEMPFDKTKNQRKGFCFITFESEQVVQELLKTPKQTIGGKEVDVKKATPKPDNNVGMRGGRGGRSSRGSRGGTRRGGRGGSGGSNYGNYYDYYGGGYGGGGYGYGPSGYDYTGYDYSNYGDYGGYGSGYESGYGGARGGRGRGSE